ncbi:hypothetical protein BUALT_Bualt12G0052300 [Buddleja alternifolia]|uniref:F-box domain-containing protein n=1 Tax=Buddleja alternifolia TaxID=168488 RepID=A0AAV6WWV4_9LAMI|nr:hypothetical protein BUALT_Bualt12G0052300 [Buddleja alternifolia]
MSVLPDELWRRIMEIGIGTKSVDYKGICCLSITCRRLRRLAGDDSLWSPLLHSDFRSSSNDFNSSSNDNRNCNSDSSVNGKFKSLYKIRYEKEREQKRLAQRRVVLRIESEIAERLRKIQEIEFQSSEEKDKMNKAVAELLNLNRVRQASVGLNVWQPEIIRGRQKQMIQQSNVPVDFRINALEMELSLCKQQIAGFDKALRVEKRRLDAAKEQLASVKYHPLQIFSSSSCQPKECRTRSMRKREQKCLAHRRVVLRIESEIAERSRKTQEIELQSSEEKEKMNKAVAELLILRKFRPASVASNVWQPEIIRGRQKQMIQQNNVPVDIHINALAMELGLCKQQIAGFDKALQVDKRTLGVAKEQLASVKYHPLQDVSSSSCQPKECRITNMKRRKRDCENKSGQTFEEESGDGSDRRERDSAMVTTRRTVIFWSIAIITTTILAGFLFYMSTSAGVKGGDKPYIVNKKKVEYWLWYLREDSEATSCGDLLRGIGHAYGRFQNCHRNMQKPSKCCTETTELP